MIGELRTETVLAASIGLLRDALARILLARGARRGTVDKWLAGSRATGPAGTAAAGAPRLLRKLVTVLHPAI